MTRAKIIKRGAVCALFATLMVAACAPPALASSPWWHVFSGSRPAVLQPGAGQKDQIVVSVANLGDEAIDGEHGNPVRIVDRLPPGLHATSVLKVSGIENEVAGTVECTLEQSNTVVMCTFANSLRPYQQLELVIDVTVPEEGRSGANRVTIVGGGAPPASVARRVAIGTEAPKFGVEDFEVATEEEGGEPDTQAGSHPFQTTFSLVLDQSLAENVSGLLHDEPEPFVSELPKDVEVKLPPGMIGNPTAVPRCPLPAFLAKTPTCPPSTIVGVAMVTIDEGARGFALATVSTPVFNLEPREGIPGHPLTGEPARFGFSVAEVPVFLDTELRADGDYGVTTKVENITQTTAFLANKVIIWGVPGDSRHDSSRGFLCVENGVECQKSNEREPTPFFTLPTSCSGKPLASEVLVDSWNEPGKFVDVLPTRPLPAMDGCLDVPFGGEVKVQPSSTAASTPTGLNADVHIPQAQLANPNGLAPADVRDITVGLPEGLGLNPSAADGLQACSEEQVGYEREEEPAPGSGFSGNVKVFNERPKYPEPEEPGVNMCPNASKLGTVTINTPLLPRPLNGGVYLATPAPNGEAGMNPFNSLVALYIVAEDPISGSRVKLAGEVHLSETGQIVSTFENNPQLPFEDAELHFFNVERASLATPARCGAYAVNAVLAPWSGAEPLSGVLGPPFPIGPGPIPCPGSTLPLTPTLEEAATNKQAGGFSSLTTTIARPDGNQNLRSVQLRFPPGLSGVLSGVKLCPEEQANAGTCPPESEIGESTVSAGVGGDPFTVKGGKVYLTGKYHGAPFGLSIVTPAVAGPFNLGTVVVRARIEVDLHTAALTVTTNSPAEGYAIPRFLDGVPLQIRDVNVTVTRPGFTFNPTNCSPLAVTGAITGAEGGSAPISVPFTVANCANLKFAPTFKVSTSGKTSRLNGASLVTKITYPPTPPGGQATNSAGIAFAKVELPKVLPSRLPTLQKACLIATFEANPANCPAASVVGHARVITPVLPEPLTGPAYLISHGGEEFPSLTIVLQGYGVTVELIGITHISPNAITSTTFNSTPDVPFSLFELTLPEGRYSALAATANLCKAKNLVMPTHFIAQNGMELKQNTKIAVTGCPKAKKKAKHAKRASRRKKH